MMKTILAILLLALATYAAPVVSFYPTGYDYNVRDFSAASYGTQAINSPNLFGQLKYYKLVNTGGDDATCKLYDQDANVIFTTTVISGATHKNSTVANYSIWGALNLSCASNYTSGGSLPSTLAAFYKLDEGTGNTTTAAIGSDTLELSAALGQGAPTWGVGKFANSTTLDGVNDSMRLNASATLNITAHQNFTISFWLNALTPLGTNKTAYLIHKGALGGNATTGENNTAIRAVNNTAVTWTLKMNGSTQTVTAENTSGLFSASGWNLFTFVKNATDASIWRNGVRLANQSWTGTQFINNSAQPFYFGDGYDTGNSSVSYSANWGYDQIMYFNTSLNSSAIGYLFNQSRGLALTATMVSYRQ